MWWGIVEAIGTGAVTLAIDSALAGDGFSSFWSCLEAKDEADWVMTRFRSAYRDTATLVYPWRPDE